MYFEQYKIMDVKCDTTKQLTLVISITAQPIRT